MVNGNDWRLTNQLSYLQGVELKHIKYQRYSESWDHDHCIFCWEKFDSESQVGYMTVDNYYWVCEQCFSDFKEMFKWRVVNRS